MKEQNTGRNYVGLLTKTPFGGLVVLDKADKEIGRELVILKANLNGAPFGMKVVAERIGRGTGEAVFGNIIEVLGDPGRPDVAMTGIIRQFGLDEEFPAAVLDEAEKIPSVLTSEEIGQALASGCRDLRGFSTLTIDGDDAKDLDDAIDIKKNDDGTYTLYVHIADVSHYVREGSALDREALRRGNSVYLVDRVLPMLPPKLSNGICSLNPGAVRRALTCEMTIDGSGQVIDSDLYTSLIESKARATYEEVRALLEGEAKPDPQRPEHFLEELMTMRELSLILEEKRSRRGALEFDFPETYVELDGEGNPLAIYPYPISFANGIIEEFMIVANETVAETLDLHRIPGIFRVHDLPDPKKLAAFSAVASQLGTGAKLRGEVTPKQLAAVLKSLEGKPYRPMLSQLLLRALAKADYRAENVGHFGLASESYCHFTAPIRRYADLFVHRQLKAHLAADKSGRRAAFSRAPAVAEHISETERTAMEAERATVDRKAAEYYATRIGEKESGIVAGMSKSAFYVQLDNTVEGAVFFRTLDGYYRFDEKRLSAVREGGGASIRIGDRVRVEVSSVDINRHLIDFRLISHAEAKSAGSGEKVAYKSKKKAAKKLAKERYRRDRRRRR